MTQGFSQWQKIVEQQVQVWMAGCPRWFRPAGLGRQQQHQNKPSTNQKPRGHYHLPTVPWWWQHVEEYIRICAPVLMIVSCKIYFRLLKPAKSTTWVRLLVRIMNWSTWHAWHLDRHYPKKAKPMHACSEGVSNRNLSQKVKAPFH